MASPQTAWYHEIRELTETARLISNQRMLLVLLLAKIWAIGYGLLILCIVLGIAAVVRPSSRKPEKPEEKPLV